MIESNSLLSVMTEDNKSWDSDWLPFIFSYLNLLDNVLQISSAFYHYYVLHLLYPDVIVWHDLWAIKFHQIRHN